MEVKLDIEIAVDARDPRFGGWFWRILREDFSALFPGKYGDFEPLPYELKGGEVDRLVDSVAPNRYTLIWKPKKTPAVHGIIDFTNGRDHSAITIYGSAKHLCAGELINLLFTIAAKFPISLGFVHLLAEPEFEATRPWHDQLYRPFNSRIRPNDLERYLPNLGWLTYLGQPYVEMIGACVIASTPAHLVERCDEGYYIQLTEDIQDVASGYAQFEELRDAAKAHLGRQFFFDTTGTVERYMAPKFKYPELWQPDEKGPSRDSGSIKLS